MRGRKPRSWVRIDCAGLLHGSINWQLTLEEQAIWVKLIAYSEVCGGPAGMICDNDGRPLPHEFIAHECHCSVELLKSCLAKCQEEGRISENSHGIRITNFDIYQFTEYDRQKPYRDAKKKRGISGPTPEEAWQREYENQRTLMMRAKKKGLGRDLTTEERLEVEEKARKAASERVKV